jgi:Cytochrome c554 and c-prime
MKAARFAWLLVMAGCSQGPNGSSVEETTYPVEQLMDPETCKECHKQHYQQWSGSMHAYASDDPLFIALNKRGQEQAKIGKFCVKCHAPMAVAMGLTEDGLNLASLDKKWRGVTCYFCHGVDEVRGIHDNPLNLAKDATMRGQFADAVANKAHRSAYSNLHDGDRLESAAMCGSCHDIVNDHGTHLERTFSEWQETVFSHPATGTTCNQCHMYRSTKVEPAAEAPGVFARYLHDHKMPGVDLAITEWADRDAQRQAVQDFLSTELQTALCVRGFGDIADLQVVVDNIASGHKWPSGAAQDRRLWFEVTAYAGGSQIYQSGAVPPGTEPTTLNDPDFWLIRDCIFDAQGTETHMFWDAASFESNQLPGQLTFDRSSPDFYKSHVFQTYPRATSTKLSTFPDRVTLRVQLQSFPLELYDELFGHSDDHGFTPEQVQAMRQQLATPFTVGAELEWTPATATQTFYEMQTPVSCVSKTNMNAAASKVPATRHTNCKP